MWVLCLIRPSSSCETFWTVFFSVKVEGLDMMIVKILTISVFFGFNFAFEIFQFLWNSPQKVVSNSSTFFLWFELKKKKKKYKIKPLS